MSPRLLDPRLCPHCRAELPQPAPRVCPSCAGSLQKRFLSCGCLSSAPPVVLAVLGAGWIARADASVADDGSGGHDPAWQPRSAETGHHSRVNADQGCDENVEAADDRVASERDGL